ncbi:MAG TPA: hypothetical protein ENH40_06710 [Nitrospirae bacterium]|nr:hypothetical protein [Nitrospirota bacterium]HDZ62816.1 hypothetical protein [Nitrospirota bacterium]
MNDNPEPGKSKLTQEQINLAFKLERAVEHEVRRILEQLGMNMGPDTEISVIRNQMKLMSIEVIHCTFEDNPDMDGWYIKQHGKTLIIISHPIIKKGRIIIRRRVPQ